MSTRNSKNLCSTTFIATLCTLMLFSSPDLNAQSNQHYSGAIRRAVTPSWGGQQRLGQQILNQFSQPQYRQPSYVQPRCNHPVYSPPIDGRTVYIQPGYVQPVNMPPTFSQPIVTTSPAQPTQPQPVATPLAQARQHTTEAKDLFQQEQYKAAAEKLNEVVSLVPDDTNAFQFRSLTHFAAGDFEAAAADAYDALTLGNTWTREVLKSVYGTDLERYDRQIETLKQHVQDQPSMPSHFLLAYHYLLNEEWATGEAQLQAVLEIQKDEPLTTKLLAAVKGR